MPNLRDIRSTRQHCKELVAFNGTPSRPQWWHNAVIYQIYPRSFQDSNGDGIGDLRGISSRLGYLHDLGVGAIWLSPIYKSPMVDMGYDVEDYFQIDPIFGTMEDFDGLLEATHKLGMKLIMDFVPNHTSDKHTWFQQSILGRDNPHSDYYVWHDGKVLEDGTRAPPNNWIGCFGGSAWTWNEQRQQFYYHQFLVEQPDLNWRNPNVQRDMMKVLTFWLDKGVDGFRVDAIETLFETEDVTQDEPRSLITDAKPDENQYLSHIYTRNLDETFDMVRQWRQLMDKNAAEHNRDPAYMILEVYCATMQLAARYYDTGPAGPFIFNLIEVTKDTDAIGIYHLVDSCLEMCSQAADRWPNWATGNHDVSRISGRKGVVYVKAFNTLLLLLPGTATTYQGEELGMLDVVVPFEMTQDAFALNYGKERYLKYTRDKCRTPIQWTTEKNAGFSTATTTWLPVHQDSATINAQVESGDVTSVLSHYKALTTIRRQPSFQHGRMIYDVINNNIFSFVRHAAGHPAYLVVLNFGKVTSTDDYEITLDGVSMATGEIVLSSCVQYAQGNKVALKAIQVNPGYALVIRLGPA